MAGNGHFWRNVVLICVAHAIAIIGVVRWNGAGANISRQTSFGWRRFVGLERSHRLPLPPRNQRRLVPLTRRLPPISGIKESLLLASAKSEIELAAHGADTTPKPRRRQTAPTSGRQDAT